ncbi:MAG: acyl-CoA ligase (AMP-forming) (exosortase A-associated) [Halioglobus sp.]|jgi:acyl-CoA ligase (AMP-forming) (exosortase A-associated)
MPDLIHQCISRHAKTRSDDIALLFKDTKVRYGEFQQAIEEVSEGLLALGIEAGERVAIYLPKQPEAIYGIFGTASAGACFVPINPLLKPKQVAYILSHCNVKVLITSGQRLGSLASAMTQCPNLQSIVLVEEDLNDPGAQLAQHISTWPQFIAAKPSLGGHRRIDADMAAILYTSGSTGNPKGVVLSHRNMVAGANSVASYLENTSNDRILAVLPLSFDAGLSQLTTAFSAGASVVLMDYLLPRDVIRAVARYQITGLGAVPPLWNQLVGLDWPDEAKESLRYITNTGGAMPVATTRGLQKSLPNTDIFLMYGLTEAFRSTYLPPDQVNIRPESMGKAVPNAEILVINENGEECEAGEPGELVHRGALVAMGYWNDPEKTAERFKPYPAQPAELPITELAVWSGDQVKKDEEGYLYFVSRKDDMIKTSGYRVSPTEVEEIVYGSNIVSAAVAIGLTHPTLGQAILLLLTPSIGEKGGLDIEANITAHCRREMPNFMVPQKIICTDSLPHNQNGKIDRKRLAEEYRFLFNPTQLIDKSTREQNT